MMKTITEYQPMIYSVLLTAPSRRRTRREQALRAANVGVRISYAAAILAIMAQTGLAAWNWQFWIMFAPMLALGEYALHTLEHCLSRTTSGPAASVPVAGAYRVARAVLAAGPADAGAAPLTSPSV